MARRYETVYIFDPALEEPAINEKLEKFHAQLTRDGKGTVANVAHWGKRTLAYPIKKKDSGAHVLAAVGAAPAGRARRQRVVHDGRRAGHLAEAGHRCARPVQE